MPTLYVIRDWDRHFEVAQSKRSERTRWVPLPNKHDGKSYRRLMRLKGGAAIYGGWVLIVQVASKCPVRGRLEDADGPLTATDIADKTLADEKTIQSALDACSSREIGWIEKLEIDSERTPTDSERAQQMLPTRHNRTEQDRTEQNSASGAIGDVRPPRQPPTKPFDASEVALPAELDTPEFREAWLKWVEFRRKKRKPVSEDAAREQLAKLIRYGPDGAVESISNSIASDYQGLFEPKSIKASPANKFSGIQGFLEDSRD